ncbi:MAG: hypothetical protein ACI9N9_001771 [Enterobacterales bacterium]|jgi:hypothetical protein
MSEENQQQDPNTAFNEQDWVNKQSGAVLSYCSRKELNVTNFIDTESAILPPFVAVWLVESKPSKEKYWVISGDLPLDHIPVKLAKNPREVIRHFSLGWQLKAERLMTGSETGQPQLGDTAKQTDFAKLLVSRAEILAEMAENDKIWIKQQP